jgi:hypothetical protein
MSFPNGEKSGFLRRGGRSCFATATGQHASGGKGHHAVDWSHEPTVENTFASISSPAGQIPASEAHALERLAALVDQIPKTIDW